MTQTTPVIDRTQAAGQAETGSERRVWLPTAYAKQVLINGLPPSMSQREAMWRVFPASADAMAREADVLVVPVTFASRSWQPRHRDGAWVVYRSTLR